jgi:transposase
MITIGIDAHKTVHVAVALDDAGQEIASWRGPNSVRGWRELVEWSQPLGDTRRWAIEGAWGYGRGLAQSLVGRGETVHEVNTRWTALGRRSGRRDGKTDRFDARGVALVLRQEPGLPLVTADDDTVILDVLVTERAAALVEATRIRNQIHSIVMHIDPEYALRMPRLASRAGIKALLRYRSSTHDPLQEQRAATVRRLAARLHLTIAHADDIATEIRARAGRFAPLTELCGVNLLTAGALAAILGPGRRFASDAQLAAYAGAAPLEASSAGTVRHRLNRGGNRRLNAILYQIAITQAHHSPQARTYLERRVREGKTRREARRALKRYIIRAIWRLWQECQPAAIPSASVAA